MLTGIPTLGCWEITSRHQDEELTFVAWVKYWLSPCLHPILNVDAAWVQAYVCLEGVSPMNPNPPKKPPTTVTSEAIEAEDLESRIRQRAHELYEARGREDGHELEDWLRAEEELTENAEEKLPEKKTPLIAA